MKWSAKGFRYESSVLLIAAVAAVASAAGCSAKQPSQNAAESRVAPVQQALLNPVAATTVQPVLLKSTKQVASRPKPPASKVLRYRSRDYGIAFDYPWQYAYVSAPAMARANAGAENGATEQDLTLARVEIPKGFYPDTDFEGAAMTVSVNQNMEEEGCYASVGASNDSDAQTETINGVPFRWDEKDEGGPGKALKQRTYVTFANDTCYRLDLMVKTSNDGAVARELDPDQVFQRLDAMLKTVRVSGDGQKTMPAQPVAAVATAPESDK
jgi:hypothetical protein